MSVLQSFQSSRPPNTSHSGVYQFPTWLEHWMSKIIALEDRPRSATERCYGSTVRDTTWIVIAMWSIVVDPAMVRCLTSAHISIWMLWDLVGFISMLWSSDPSADFFWWFPQWPPGGSIVYTLKVKMWIVRYFSIFCCFKLHMVLFKFSPDDSGVVYGRFDA